MNILRQNQEGLALYNMAQMLNKNPSNLYRKLQKLVNHNFVSKLKSSVAIYKLNIRNIPKVYYDVMCPKCRTISVSDSTQLTKVCPNNECKTNKGKRTRFFITDKRIVDKKVI